MTVAGAAPSVAPARVGLADGVRRLAAGVGRFWGRPWVPDLTVIAAYLLGGLYLTAKLWLHPDRMVNYWPDEVLFEWHLPTPRRR